MDLPPYARPVLLTLILLAGIAFRIVPSGAFKGTGFDEALYRAYVNAVDKVGIANYGELSEAYITAQERRPTAILPPTRFLYIFCGWAWKSVTGFEAQRALRHVSCAFSIAALLIASAAAWRMGGPDIGLGVAALMAVAPTQVHMAQHALIDGVFGCTALLCLWLLWECLRAPDNKRFAIAYALAIALMVTVKENAFFAYVGLSALLALNRWAKWGTVSRDLLVFHGIGPALGLSVLFWAANGPDFFVRIYTLLVTKAQALPYAIATGDGPWHRYLVDLVAVSPLVMLLAIAGAFVALRTRGPALFLLAFVAITYIPMTNVRYAMNLRYANMWDMPLRFLACTLLASLVPSLGPRARIGAALAIALAMFVEFRQYTVLFVEHSLYELVTQDILSAQDILKPMPADPPPKP